MMKIMMDPAIIDEIEIVKDPSSIIRISSSTRNIKLPSLPDTNAVTNALTNVATNAIDVQIQTDMDDFSSDGLSQNDLLKEYKENINYNIPYQFTDIVDHKHTKYMQYYDPATINQDSKQRTLFWGLGIENESYFMIRTKQSKFADLRHKRERYSVDYFKNFKPEPLAKTLQSIASQNRQQPIQYPIYVNAHSFQATDSKNEHRTIYDEFSTPNHKFTESIHDVLLRESTFYKEVYDNSVVFDGDSIEFITQQFYNTTVADCVAELCTLKRNVLKEISPYFTQWGEITFPDHNYGLVTFLTTYRRNLGICNNGTLHLNITLPTVLENGIIVNKHKFAEDHLRLITCIQMVEPLLVACYGTPDVFSVVDDNACNYSVGSLRVTLSRYISLQTFDVDRPVNGKLLLHPTPADPNFWYNQFHDVPYVLNREIGYDVNFNKFKNHGIELRFFDWFPEKYIGDVLNFIILLAQHTTCTASYNKDRGSFSFDKTRYNSIIMGCLRKGFSHILTIDECNVILGDLRLPFVTECMAPHTLLSYISDALYDLYKDGEIVKNMSPNMVKPCIHNYNKEAYRLLYGDIYGEY